MKGDENLIIKQKNSYMTFQQFINNPEILKKLMVHIIQYLMCIKEEFKSNNSKEFENYLDNQEQKDIDTVISEFELSIKRIGTVIIEQMFLRNFEIVHSIYLEMLNEMISSNYNSSIKYQIYDNVFNVLGYLPKVYLDVLHKSTDKSIQ